MTDLAARALHARIQSLDSKSLSLIRWRDLTGASPELRAAAEEAEPWLGSAIEMLADGLPLPRTVGPYVDQPFYRPPGSNRSFYFCPSTENAAGSGDHRSVAAIKGLEPRAPDIDVLFRDLRRSCYSRHNIAEHFVFEENRIPGCLGLTEAVREAERAAAIHVAHLRWYGSLAHLPLPLFVYRHSDETVDTIRTMLGGHLSAAATEAIGPLLDAGLGVYVYYYPAPPVRARDLDYLLAGSTFRSRMISLINLLGSPEAVFRRWAVMFVRIIYLGFLPASLASLRTGNCCQPQNACVDGGFVDLDSITPIADLPDSTAVDAAIQYSFSSLLRTVRTCVTGSTDPTRADEADDRVDLHHLAGYLLSIIQDALISEARHGLELDPRVRRFLTPPSSLAELVDRLASYFAPQSEFSAAANAFRAFGLTLIPATDDP